MKVIELEEELKSAGNAVEELRILNEIAAAVPRAIQQTAQTGLAYSDPLPDKVSPLQKISKLELSETNYLDGLLTSNTGIKSSCAYFLGELKSKRALFPLMEMFRETESVGEKLVLLWFPLKIGDSRQ